MLKSFPYPFIADFYPIDLSVSQIKVWLLEKTILFIFFSTSSIISKAGSAVHDTKRASASLVSKLIKVSDKYFESTFAIFSSKSILKVLNDTIFIFFFIKIF